MLIGTSVVTFNTIRALNHPAVWFSNTSTVNTVGSCNLEDESGVSKTLLHCVVWDKPENVRAARKIRKINRLRIV